MQTFRKKPTRNKLAAIGFAMSLCLIGIATGCSNQYGTFTLDHAVTRNFIRGVPQSDYRYYYAGRDTMPYAIIGIDRSYEVPSPYWLPFEPDPETMKRMSGNIYGKQQRPPSGSRMLTPDGQVVGVWFSSVDIHSLQVDSQNRTVTVLFKNPENTKNRTTGGGFRGD